MKYLPFAVLLALVSACGIKDAMEQASKKLNPTANGQSTESGFEKSILSLESAEGQMLYSSEKPRHGRNAVSASEINVPVGSSVKITVQGTSKYCGGLDYVYLYRGTALISTAIIRKVRQSDGTCKAEGNLTFETPALFTVCAGWNKCHLGTIEINVYKDLN